MAAPFGRADRRTIPETQYPPTGEIRAEDTSMQAQLMRFIASALLGEHPAEQTGVSKLMAILDALTNAVPAKAAVGVGAPLLSAILPGKGDPHALLKSLEEIFPKLTHRYRDRDLLVDRVPFNDLHKGILGEYIPPVDDIPGTVRINSAAKAGDPMVARGNIRGNQQNERVTEMETLLHEIGHDLVERKPSIAGPSGVESARTRLNEGSGATHWPTVLGYNNQQQGEEAVVRALSDRLMKNEDLPAYSNHNYNIPIEYRGPLQPLSQTGWPGMSVEPEGLDLNRILMQQQDGPAIRRHGAFGEEVEQYSPEMQLQSLLGGQDQPDTSLIPQDLWQLLGQAQEQHRMADQPPAYESLFAKLYRGESSAPGTGLPEWLQDNPEMEPIREATGRWFTEQPGLADWYADDHGAQGVIRGLDIPRAWLDEFRVTNQPDALRYSADPENEFFLPRDWADLRE